jgi:hypothetical protein
MSKTRVRTFDTGLLVAALAVDPVAEIGVDQLLEGPPTLTVGCGEAMIRLLRQAPARAS